VTTTVAAFALTAGLVADATGGRLAAGRPDQPFETVSTDTRTLRPGALFIALAGPRFDGRVFVDEAIARGASGVLAPEAISAPSQAAVVVVPDTLVALQRLAHAVRRRSGARVVAITGSAGKTSTKEITAEFLADQHSVFRNAGNLNNHIGLPLSLLELRHGAEVAVVELGMNHAGEIHRLVEITEPDVRVWTNVGDAHIGHFESRDAIADAKAEILDNALNASLAVVHADEPLIVARLGRFAGRCVTFGEVAGADVRAVDITDRGFDGTTATVETPVGRAHFEVPLAGRAQLANVMAATAVAIEFSVPLPVIEAKASHLQAVPRRGAIFTRPDGARLVDDSYNASPSATRAMLAALQMTPTGGQRIAVLGEMLELGARSRELHADCGRAAAKADVDELVVIGGEPAGGLVDGALAEGFPPARVHRFADSATAAPAVLALVRPADLVLVKGSRGTRMDLVADALKAVR
jgi:UDP-N-acetylmuramoyl-tripeptide--D-alanyl-D-alanine ligase